MKLAFADSMVLTALILWALGGVFTCPAAAETVPEITLKDKISTAHLIVAGTLEDTGDEEWHILKVYRVLWGPHIGKGETLTFSTTPDASSTLFGLGSETAIFFLNASADDYSLPGPDYILPLQKAEVQKGGVVIHLDRVIGSSEYQKVFRTLQSCRAAIGPFYQEVFREAPIPVDLEWRNTSSNPQMPPGFVELAGGRLTGLNGAKLVLLQLGKKKPITKKLTPVAQVRQFEKLPPGESLKSHLDLRNYYDLQPGKTYRVQWFVGGQVSNGAYFRILKAKR